MINCHMRKCDRLLRLNGGRERFLQSTRAYKHDVGPICWRKMGSKREGVRKVGWGSKSRDESLSHFPSPPFSSSVIHSNSPTFFLVFLSVVLTGTHSSPVQLGFSFQTVVQGNDLETYLFCFLVFSIYSESTGSCILLKNLNVYV